MNDLITISLWTVSIIGVFWWLGWGLESFLENYCKIFGHKMPTGYHGGGEYLKQVGSAIDGIDRFHIRLYATCANDYCDHQIHVGNIHHKTSKQFHPKRKDLWYLDEFTNDPDLNKQMLKGWYKALSSG